MSGLYTVLSVVFSFSCAEFVPEGALCQRLERLQLTGGDVVLKSSEPGPELEFDGVSGGPWMPVM